MVSNLGQRYLILIRLLLLIPISNPFWVAYAKVSVSSIVSSSLEDRVTTLERISNAQAQLMQELQQQMSDNQRDIDLLRGEIQQNTYHLNQIVERQKQLYKQTDSLNSKTVQTIDRSINSVLVSNGVTDDGVASTHGTLVQNGDDSSDYKEAVAMILENKKYEKAIIALQRWLKRYPHSIYQPNAKYWLGQLYYNEGKQDDAAYYYATVAKEYPNSLKAAEALFKVGVIMQEKNDIAKAKTVYHQVIKLYPNTKSAQKSQKKLFEM